MRPIQLRLRISRTFGGRNKHSLPQWTGQAHRVNLACELNGRLRASSVGCEIVQYRVGGWERAMIRNKSCKATLAAPCLFDRECCVGGFGGRVLQKQTVAIHVGAGVGSAYDVYARAIARYGRSISPVIRRSSFRTCRVTGGVVQNYNVFTAARWESGKTVAVEPTVLHGTSGPPPNQSERPRATRYPLGDVIGFTMSRNARLSSVDQGDLSRSKL